MSFPCGPARVRLKEPGHLRSQDGTCRVRITVNSRERLTVTVMSHPGDRRMMAEEDAVGLLDASGAWLQALAPLPPA